MICRTHRRWFATLGLISTGIIAAAAALMSATADEAATRGPLTITVKMDLSQLRQGAILKVPVDLTNTSEKPVVVTRGVQSCNWASSDLPVTVAAKETRRITLALDTRRREGPGVLFVHLDVDGRSENATGLAAPFTVLPEFKTVPHEIDFGKVDAGAAVVPKSVFISPVADQEARILRWRMDPPLFEVGEPHLQDGPPWEFSVQPKAALPQGDYAAVLVAETTSTVRPEVRVPVRCIVEGAMVCEPEFVSLGITPYEDSGGVRATVTLHRRDSGPFTVARLAASAPYIAAACKTLGQSAASHAIEVSIDIGARPPSNTLVSESILVSETKDGDRAITIPVRGLFHAIEGVSNSADPNTLAYEWQAIQKGRPPFFRTRDLEGRDVGTPTLRGTPTVLVFFSGHPACEELARGLARADASPFAIYGLQHLGRERNRAFVERTGFRANSLLDDVGAQIGRHYRITTCPYVVVLNADLRIVMRRTVEDGETADILLQHARDALKTSPTPAP